MHYKLIGAQGGEAEAEGEEGIGQVPKSLKDLLQQAEDSFEQCRNVIKEIRRILYGDT